MLVFPPVFAQLVESQYRIWYKYSKCSRLKAAVVQVLLQHNNYKSFLRDDAMKTFLVVALFAMAMLAGPSQARTMDRCSLAREMSKLGVPRNELARWTCIAQHESSYRTGIVGPANSDGSHDYGIFQINDRYWCQPPNGKHSSNGCGLNCKDLLSDQINKSVTCARKVLAQQGWAAWSTWKFCKGNLPSIDPCFK